MSKFIEIEPRPLETPGAIKRILSINKELEYITRKYKKPIMKIRTGDRIFYYVSMFGSWLIRKSSEIAGKTLRQIIPILIPTWFWFALIGAVILTIVLIEVI